MPSNTQASPHAPSYADASYPQQMYTPIRALQQQECDWDSSRKSSNGGGSNGHQDEGGSHFSGMRLVENPPDLDEWRDKLFNVEETITMTEEEFQTYFPHVDNVYSHRSTQKYKRKPFVSHYWDCRLKGRPPGTPKSSDPSKKKRRRTARERDLCDVKIKITEYFPGAAAAMSQADYIPESLGPGEMSFTLDSRTASRQDPPQAFGVLTPSNNLPVDHPGLNGARYYTIQRISATANNETSSDTIQGHKHTLAESDKVKKHSVQRHLLKEEKERKRSNAAPGTKPNPATTQDSSLTSPLNSRASGNASSTALRHQSPLSADSNGLIFYGNSFCPFAQRVWIALELKSIPYQYIQVVPAHMPGGSSLCPESLLEVCPEGCVPCVRHGNWGAWESGVLMEYLEDLAMGYPLLPLGDAKLRAHCRLWTDHINRKILPAFYSLLLTPANAASGQTSPLHTTLTATLQTSITALVNASHATGPFFLGDSISFVDVAFAPWIIRLSRVLSFYRSWPDPEVGSRWERWVRAVEADARVMATVSDERSYHGVYEAVGREAGAGVRSIDEIQKMGKAMAEVGFARRVVMGEGFGLGGDVWGPVDEAREMDRRRGIGWVGDSGRGRDAVEQ